MNEFPTNIDITTLPLNLSTDDDEKTLHCLKLALVDFLVMLSKDELKDNTIVVMADFTYVWDKENHALMYRKSVKDKLVVILNDLDKDIYLIWQDEEASEETEENE